MKNPFPPPAWAYAVCALSWWQNDAKPAGWELIGGCAAVALVQYCYYYYYYLCAPSARI